MGSKLGGRKQRANTRTHQGFLKWSPSLFDHGLILFVPLVLWYAPLPLACTFAVTLLPLPSDSFLFYIHTGDSAHSFNSDIRLRSALRYSHLLVFHAW